MNYDSQQHRSAKSMTPAEQQTNHGTAAECNGMQRSCPDNATPSLPACMHRMEIRSIHLNFVITSQLTHIYNMLTVRLQQYHIFWVQALWHSTKRTTDAQAQHGYDAKLPNNEDK